MLRGGPRGVNANRLRTAGLTPYATDTSAPRPASPVACRCIPHSPLIVAKPQPPEQLRKSLPAEAEIGRGPAAVAAGSG